MTRRAAKLVLKASASPVLDGGGNVAISPSGKRVAVLDAGAIQVYELPAPAPTAGAGCQPFGALRPDFAGFQRLPAPCTLGCGGFSWPRRSSITWLRRLLTAAGNVLPTKMHSDSPSRMESIVVCDGMGGAAAGEIASSLAVDEVLRLLSGRSQNRPRTVARSGRARHHRRQRGHLLPRPAQPAASAAWAPRWWRWP